MKVTEDLIQRIVDDIRREYTYHKLGNIVMSGVNPAMIMETISDNEDIDPDVVKIKVISMISNRLDVIKFIGDNYYSGLDLVEKVFISISSIIAYRVIESLSYVNELDSIDYSIVCELIDRILFHRHILNMSNTDKIDCIFNSNNQEEIAKLFAIDNDTIDINTAISAEYTDENEKAWRINHLLFRLANIPEDQLLEKSIELRRVHDLDIESLRIIDKTINFYSSNKDVIDIVSKELEGDK